MIHYTLLPEKEMRALKREYKTRVFVMFLLFISIGVIIGIAALFPAYVSSYLQGRDSLIKVETLEKNRAARDIKNISKELADSYKIINTLKTNEFTSGFSETITEIAKLRPAQVTLNSLILSRTQSTTTSSIQATVQGKALTRESLLEFKKRLEADERVAKVDLPVSDLAK